MIAILVWLIFGLIIGLIAKAIHPGYDPVGFLPTLGIGIAGSFLGGFISYLLSFGGVNYRPAGFVMSIIGALLFCSLWRYYNLNVK
jgi:uncharacterized membrane protein YeaQ/YmgE (transglycosylase-associated protein family)